MNRFHKPLCSIQEEGISRRRGETEKEVNEIEAVIFELKSVERVSPAHKKQLLTCLKLTGLVLGSPLNKL